MNNTIKNIEYWSIIVVVGATIGLAILRISWLSYWMIGWALLFFLASFILLYKIYNTREKNNETNYHKNQI